MTLTPTKKECLWLWLSLCKPTKKECLWPWPSLCTPTKKECLWPWFSLYVNQLRRNVCDLYFLYVNQQKRNICELDFLCVNQQRRNVCELDFLFFFTFYCRAQSRACRQGEVKQYNPGEVLAIILDFPICSIHLKLFSSKQGAVSQLRETFSPKLPYRLSHADFTIASWFPV